MATPVLLCRRWSSEAATLPAVNYGKALASIQIAPFARACCHRAAAARERHSHWALPWPRHALAVMVGSRAKRISGRLKAAPRGVMRGLPCIYNTISTQACATRDVRLHSQWQEPHFRAAIDSPAVFRMTLRVWHHSSGLLLPGSRAASAPHPGARTSRAARHWRDRQTRWDARVTARRLG